jgi:hypothetical protein
MVPGLWLLVVFTRPMPKWGTVAAIVGVLGFGLHYSWTHGLRSERPLFVYEAVAIPEIDFEMDGAVRRPVGDSRCWLTRPPCSPYGANTETNLGGYRTYLPAE